MILKIGRKKSEVASFEEASKAWRAYRDARGLGASQSPRVTLKDGETVYIVSYNGKVWKSAGTGRWQDDQQVYPVPEVPHG